MRYIKSIVFISVVVGVLKGCITTTLYGRTFESIGDDVYVLQIAFSGSAYISASDIEMETRLMLDEEARKFLYENSEYSSYKVLSYEQIAFPQSILYHVMFKD